MTHPQPEVLTSSEGMEKPMTFLVDHLTSRIGSEIRSDMETLLSGRHARAIRDLLEHRGVVVKADYLQGTVEWHFDGFSDDVPTFVSMLSARALSATGGQTEFANAYAAFDELPDSDKARLTKLRVVHTMAANQRNVHPNPSAAHRAAWAQFPEKTHPLVWNHRSGRKSLLLGASASHIVDMDPSEGRRLLDRLIAWATQPRFVYQHAWSLGDLVMWDNTGLLHRVQPYPADSGRLMHRVTLVGEEAIA